MKKLRMGFMVFVSCLFLTACGCTKEDFNVTFDSDGGSNVKSQTVEKGETVTKPENPTKEGFSFSGWYLEDKEYDFDKEVTKNITLTAKWEENASEDENENNEEQEEEKCELTCEDGYELVNEDSADCSCKVVKVSSVSLSKSSLTLVEGDTLTVSATVKPSNAKDKAVTWKSSNEKVATVKKGKITAVSEGTATITATAGGKSSTVKVTVITKDQANLSSALQVLSAKTVSKAGTNLNYSYEGCSIEVSSYTVSSSNNSKTTVESGVVKTLYRTQSSGSISTVYEVTCGDESETKTVKHTIPASTYVYTGVDKGMTYVLNVTGLTEPYTIYIAGTPSKYRESAGGVQTTLVDGEHVKGTTYDMILNSDANTRYTVKANTQND